MIYVRPTPAKVVELREKWRWFRWNKRNREWLADLVRGHNLILDLLQKRGDIKPKDN